MSEEENSEEREAREEEEEEQMQQDIIDEMESNLYDILDCDLSDRKIVILAADMIITGNWKEIFIIIFNKYPETRVQRNACLILNKAEQLK